MFPSRFKSVEIETCASLLSSGCFPHVVAGTDEDDMGTHVSWIASQPLPLSKAGQLLVLIQAAVKQGLLDKY